MERVARRCTRHLESAGSLQAGVAVESQEHSVGRRRAFQRRNRFWVPHTDAEQDVSARRRGSHAGVRQQLPLGADLQTSDGRKGGCGHISDELIAAAQE